MGQRLACMVMSRLGRTKEASASAAAHESAVGFGERLSDASAVLTPDEFLAWGPGGLKVRGLYSWWVDSAGAGDLSAGLGLPLGRSLRDWHL